MPEASVGGGVKCRYEMAVHDKHGVLVYAEKSRTSGLLRRYDRWRSNYCHRHRHDACVPWLKFREGRTDPLTMAYALGLRISDRGANHGADAVTLH